MISWLHENFWRLPKRRRKKFSEIKVLEVCYTCRHTLHRMPPCFRLLDLGVSSREAPICMPCSSALDYLWIKHSWFVELWSESWWFLILLYLCCVFVDVGDQTSSSPRAVSSSVQHVLLCVGIHPTLQVSGFLGQSLVLSFSVSLSCPAQTQHQNCHSHLGFFEQCSDQQDITFGRWLPKQLPLQPKQADARLPGLPALHPLHKIHTLPHCFMCWLNSFKAQLGTWHKQTCTSLSLDHVLVHEHPCLTRSCSGL